MISDERIEKIAGGAGATQEEASDIARMLMNFKTAFVEWNDKTEWVQYDKRFRVIFPFYGMHRADVIKEYIKLLESKVGVPEEEGLGYEPKHPCN